MKFIFSVKCELHIVLQILSAEKQNWLIPFFPIDLSLNHVCFSNQITWFSSRHTLNPCKCVKDFLSKNCRQNYCENIQIYMRLCTTYWTWSVLFLSHWYALSPLGKCVHMFKAWHHDGTFEFVVKILCYLNERRQDMYLIGSWPLRSVR